MRPRTSLLAAALAMVAGLVMPAHAGADALQAVDEDGQVCIAIVPQQSPPGACAETDAGVVTVSGSLPGEAKQVGAAVPAAAASIEVRRAGALLASGPTLAGEAYRGVRAGSLRFARVRLPDTARLDGLRVHALDAAGTLVAVLAPDDSELVTDRRRLLSGRSARVRWSLAARQESVLAPSVLDVGRETLSQCVRVTIQRANFTGRTQSCASESPLDPLEVLEHAESAQVGSCPGFRLLHGVVAGSVVRVSVLLANGRSRTVRTVPVGDGRRTYALSTGSDAVRAVRFITAAGAVRTVRRGLAPLAVECAAGDRGFFLGSAASFSLDELPVVTTAGPGAALTAPPPFRVADGPAGSLCLALGDKPFRLGGCGIVSPWLGVLLNALDSYGDPHALALAVPQRVAAVRMSSASGKIVRVIPTVGAAGYTGPHAGYVRFAATTFGAVSELARIELLDAAGAILWRGAETDDDFLLGFSGLRLGTPRRVAGRAQGPSLWQTRGGFGQVVGRCYTLTDGSVPGPGADCEDEEDGMLVLLDASCTTQRLTVAVVARPGTRVLADVGASSPRRMRMRFGRALLTLPAAQPLRALTFIRKGRARRLRINAPPGARQCGWRAAPEIE